MATAQEVLDALYRAGRGVQTYRELPAGLRRAHLYVLHALESLGGTARVTDIADRALVKVPNMTRLLKETDEAGWTARTTGPVDRRTVLVQLTPDGSACLRTYYWDYLDAIAEDLHAEDHPEYDVMITAIDRAIETIERVTDTIDDSWRARQSAPPMPGRVTISPHRDIGVVSKPVADLGTGQLALGKDCDGGEE